MYAVVEHQDDSDLVDSLVHIAGLCKAVSPAVLSEQQPFLVVAASFYLIAISDHNADNEISAEAYSKYKLLRAIIVEACGTCPELSAYTPRTYRTIVRSIYD